MFSTALAGTPHLCASIFCCTALCLCNSLSFPSTSQDLFRPTVSPWRTPFFFLSQPEIGASLWPLLEKCLRCYNRPVLYLC